MDAQVIDRLLLRRLREQHPEWTYADYAAATKRSISWVTIWVRRLRGTDPADLSVVLDRSRRRHTPTPPVAPLLVERMLALRDAPPAGLGRTPGPKTIAYFLARDPAVREAGVRVPAPSTIWRVLHAHGRIAQPQDRTSTPLPRPEPFSSWQLDYKDAGLPVTDSDGKQQHVVEVLNAVDVGTSRWMDHEARPDFTMATTIEAVARMLERTGVPTHINVDRDPRFVGSQLPRETPSPFVRFAIACGVAVTLSPPRRPQTNGVVERFHRTLGTECLKRKRPHDLPTLQEVLADFAHHYNHERPHQGLSCQNRPPAESFPACPALPPLPDQLDPDRWLLVLHGHVFTSMVGRDGSVKFDQRSYYVGQAYARQEVTLEVDGHAKVLLVRSNQQVIKRLPLKGLVGAVLPRDQAIAYFVAEARRFGRQRIWRQRTMW